jgi:hypothetical protein
MKQGSTLYTVSQSKASIVPRKFKFVFTKDEKSSIHQLNGPKYQEAPPLTIHTDGVCKLLKNLKPEKASGADKIFNRALKELCNELAPAVSALFTRTLEIGTVPKDWTDAAISPIYKKGNAQLVSNYRPVSITCILSIVMEHIMCKHILNHLDSTNILASLQHGSIDNDPAKVRSFARYTIVCAPMTREIRRTLESSTSYEHLTRLLGKLKHYGITDQIHAWIKPFLCDRGCGS